MYNIRLGYGCGIKATLLTSTGAVFDLRKARYKGAVLMLPNGASIPCADVSIDDVTNSVYVRLLADRELTMIGKYGIMFNLKLANGVMYSSPMVVFAEVSADAEVEYKELNISLGVALTYLPANVAYTGASPKIGPNGTWLVYNDERNAYEDTGEPANYGGLLGEVQSLKDIIETSLTPHFITNAVKVDWKTIGKNADGELCYIGAGIGDNEGNIDIAILDGYLTDRGYAKHIDIAKEYATKEWVEKKKFITIDSLPQKISAFANDKGYITIDALAPYATLATTLGGYGITNAYTKTETDARIFGEVKRLFEDPRLVTAAVNIDGRTIKRDGNGALYVDETALKISGGGGGGGVADSVYWNNVIGKPSWIGSTKPSYKYSEIEEKPDLSVYAKLTDIPSLNGYATQSWVEGKKYLTGITSSMITSALGFTPYNSANFTKANIKSTLGISDWALASVKPTYKYSEISNTPDLSVYALNTDLGKKWTQNDAKIANWDSAYSWGNHANAGYAKASDVTNEFKNYVKLAGDAQSITAQHNFANGLKIGGLSLRKVDDYLYLDSSLVLSGGVTMYGDDDTTVKPIWESIPLDESTLAWIDGNLSVVGGVGSGGGISEEFLNVTLQGYQPKITSSNKLAYSLISGTPDLSVFALKSEIPSLNGYATQSWVENKGYLLATTASSTYQPKITSSNKLAYSLISGTPDLSEYFLKSSFTKANIKSTLGISDWALASVKPTYTASEVGALAQDSSSVNADLDTILDSKTAVLKPFFQVLTNNNVGSARKGVLRMSYNGSESQLLFDHYSRLLRYRTIGENPKDWATLAFTSDIPTKLSQLTDDVVAGKYLLLSGGTVSGTLSVSSILRFSDTDGTYKILLQRDSSGNILFGGGFSSNNMYIDANVLRIRATESIFSSKVTAPSFIGNLTGNADSATKLATPRTIWGKEFDGTGNISGSINSVNVLRYSNGGSEIYLRGSLFSSQLSDLDIGINAGISAFNGNVAIGGTTADAKLHVHGTAKFTGDTTFSSKVVIGTIPVYQSADGTLFVDANVVFRGGVAMYGNTTTTINEE